MSCRLVCINLQLLFIAHTFYITHPQKSNDAVRTMSCVIRQEMTPKSRHINSVPPTSYYYVKLTFVYFIRLVYLKKSTFGFYLLFWYFQSNNVLNRNSNFLSALIQCIQELLIWYLKINLHYCKQTSIGEADPFEQMSRKNTAKLWRKSTPVFLWPADGQLTLRQKLYPTMFIGKVFEQHMLYALDTRC